MQHGILKRNNVTVIGEGTQTLMLAHGLGCDQHMWRHIAPAFAQDYRLVLFDYVGSGKSDINAYNPVRYSDLGGYSKDVLEICQELDLNDVIFVGHSVSSMIGLRAAVQAPQRFDRLIMIGPSPRYLNENPDYMGGFEQADIDELLTMMDENYVRWANTLGPAIMGNPDQPNLGQELIDSFCSIDSAIMRQFAQATFLSDTRQELAKLQSPALILQCSQDIISPLFVGEYTHKHLPNSMLWYMKATGHCPNLSASEETISLMSAYLSTVHQN